LDTTNTQSNNMKMVDGPEFTANVPPTYGEINGKPLMPVLEGGAKPVGRR